MNKTLEQILESSRTYTSEGRVADYIPELAKANREEIGIFVATAEGDYSEHRKTDFPDADSH